MKTCDVDFDKNYRCPYFESAGVCSIVWEDCVFVWEPPLEMAEFDAQPASPPLIPMKRGEGWLVQINLL